MENNGALVVRVLGKNMDLNVYEDRVTLHKHLWSTSYSASYTDIHSVLFRAPSYEKTGFIKIRGIGIVIDLVTYKTHTNDTTEQIDALQNAMHFAISEIEKRVKVARGLPDNAFIVRYF